MADNAPIYIGDPSHLQDGIINYVHRGMQGAFLRKKGTFGHVGLFFALNPSDKCCVGISVRILDLAKRVRTFMLAEGNLLIVLKDVRIGEFWGKHSTSVIRHIPLSVQSFKLQNRLTMR